MSRASDFALKLAEKPSSDSIRCPYLASIEIEKRKLIYGRGDMDKLIEAMMRYFCQLGSCSLVVLIIIDIVVGYLLFDYNKSMLLIDQPHEMII